MAGSWNGLLDEVGGSVSPGATHLDNPKKAGFPRHLPHARGYSQEKSGPRLNRRTLVTQEKRGHQPNDTKRGREGLPWQTN